MKRRGRLLLALAPLALAAAFLHTFSAAPLPAPPPLQDPLPPATPPPGMSLHHLPTGVTHRSAAFAYRGGSFSDRRDFTMSAALIKHPRGDILIDTGFGRSIDAQFATMPFYFRATTSYETATPAADQLDAIGHAREGLRVLLTHAHWDHVSGLADLPGVPVLVTAEERRFIAEGGWISAVARDLEGVHYATYAFTDGPYLGFTASHDLYGDGAIVIVPAPGHTPGSVVVFVALPTGRRYAFIGDLAWQHEGVADREERPWLQRCLADHDPALVRADLLRMAAILARFPAITIVPAHDARAFAELPPL